MRYPDEYIDYWSDVFIERGLWNHGITLERFLVNPRPILERIGRIEAAAESRAGDGIEPGAQFDRPPQHKREVRRENRCWLRGAVVIQKLWHTDRRRNRTNSPLPGRR